MAEGPGETGPAAGGKEDRWDATNRPDHFEGELDYRLENLPLSGRAAREAWPSTYWPTFEDSINHRWHGDDLSPAEKYDMAFNGWMPPEGFDELRPFDRSRPKAGEDWDPEYYEKLGPLASHISQSMGNREDRETAMEHGGKPEDGEWPVESWWGLCHAWVPASMLEERPLRAVTHNGVTFEVADMEALLIAAYNRASAQMIGGRCNRGAGDEDYEVDRDEHGRAVDNECRDTNPGSLHVIMTNYLGLMNRPFAEDRTYDYEVWNQPVVEYEIDRMDEISIAQAHERLGVMGDTYVYNEDAATLYDVHATITYITESHASKKPSDTARYERTDRYTYILEVDAEGKVIGGEYYGASRETHPDFLWNPERVARSSVPHLDIDEVRMLVEMSRAPAMPDSGGSLEYAIEPNAAIPDDDEAGVTSVIEVPDAATVGAVEVGLDIEHSYVGDLEVVLEHGDVKRVIHNREGGNSDDLTETLMVVGFDGVDAAGVWRLTVRDHARLDTGTLRGWKLRITPAGG